MHGEDFKEGVTAQTEKRPPRFKGLGADEQAASEVPA